MRIPDRGVAPLWARRPVLPRRGDRGSVTAEAAVGLPALVAVLGAALWAVALVSAQLACVDAARAGARAAARGEPAAAVRAAAALSAPHGAEITVSIAGEMARVTISAQVRPTWGRMLPPVHIEASASAATEPGLADLSDAMSPGAEQTYQSPGETFESADGPSQDGVR
ncbi:TadE family type IV pilus minor pilin [Microtetraspora niveoalba]|uniref:TadE family type IV pilus minor pilin n=1 Tax=Microtetraspora niveoalba TaxID=46175 RepID=UPI00157D30E2|nr:TadE family type IV pilus minor pilin [Microtetraspora niveoalba]